MDRFDIPDLSPLHQRVLAHGVRGGDGTGGEPTPRERLTEIRELVADGSRLPDTVIGALHDELTTMFRAIQAGEVESVEAHDTEILSDLRAALEACVTTTAARYEAAAAAGIQASGTPRPTLPSLAELNARTPTRRRDAPAPIAQVHESPGVRWVPTGETISDAEFARRIADYATGVGRPAPGAKVVLGQRELLAPDAVRLDSRQDAPEAIAAKLDTACRGALDPASWGPHGLPTEALLASGGWATPAPVAYDVDVLADADRPVHDALPKVEADRGGLTFVRPPTLADIETGGPDNTDAAVGVWTASADEAAALASSPRKSHQRVGQPTVRTVELHSIYESLEAGVLQARAYPEWIASWERNTEAAHARTAETKVLDDIEASAITKYVTEPITISATRDFLVYVVNLAARERNVQRMRPDTPLRLLYPSWLVDLVVMDLLRQHNLGDPRVVARTYVQEQLRAANINGVAYRDSSTDGAQLLAEQPDDDNLENLPLRVRSYLFHEGAFVIGQMPMLNVGIIRDADLVDSNDFRIFSESFEGVFDRGHFAYTLDTDLCPTGAAAATFDLSGLCVGS